jgi:hypothetical protein
VTRGYARATVTSTVDVTQTSTRIETNTHTASVFETELVPVEVWETVTATDYTTLATTTLVGPTLTQTARDTTSEQQPALTSTLTEGPIVTLTTDVTSWHTNLHSELEYSVVATSTSTVFFPATSIIHPQATVTQTLEGGPVVVEETKTDYILALTTVDAVTTVTEYEVAYETPAFNL